MVLESLRRRLRRVPLVLALVVAFLATASVTPAHADNVHRTLGGAAGTAAGALGGAALASAVIAGAGIASWGPLAVLLVGSAITVGGGFLGAKIGSFGGLSLDRALGYEGIWTMYGAAFGAIAAIALIPALGPLAGAGGLVVKGLIGGLAGGVLGRLFADELESVASPRNIYAGVGGLLGGLGFGIPGAIAGAVGGYAMGAIFGDHFFADEDRYAEDYLDDARDWGHDWTDRFEDWSWDVRDWFGDRRDDAEDFWDERWNDGRGGRGSWDRDWERERDWNWGRDRSWDRDRDWDRHHRHRRGGPLARLQEDYHEALEDFRELNEEGARQRELYRALGRLREAEARYRDALGSEW